LELQKLKQRLTDLNYLTQVRILIFLITFQPLTTRAQEKLVQLNQVKVLKRTVLTTTAYCSDGSDRAREGKPRFHGPMVARINSYKGYQYISYYEANGDIVVARNEIGQEKWEKLIIPDYKMTSHDRHNKIALGISKADGVIHLSFDHHNSETFNYSKSIAGVASDPKNFEWKSDLFQLQPNLGLTEQFGLITYPIFYEIKHSGDLLMYWRTGGATGGEMNLARYESSAGRWNFIGQISSREGSYNSANGTRGPYHAGFISDNTGVIHVGWLWREAYDQRDFKNTLGNHGISYAQSSDGGKTWFSENEVLVADVDNSLRMSIDNLGTPPISVPMRLDPSNVGFTSIYDENQEHLLFMVKHLNETMEDTYNYLYVRDKDGNWYKQKTGMKFGGSMALLGNKLLICNTTGIFYSEESEGYKIWHKLDFPFNLKSGSTQWDFDRLNMGFLSFAIQYNPKKLGEPTPVEVFELSLL
tara:strand:- start:318 stop:1733 length:1416 start_codon:yes stop_codon:yes gene_type:complete